MRLGARILKTGIAVSLALYISSLLGIDSPIFAAIAAMLTIQPSLFRSWQHVLEQLQANILGALIAFTVSYTIGNDYIIIGLVMILVIMLNLKLGFRNSIELTLITVLALMVGVEHVSWSAALQRFSAILTGIFSSMFINMLFLPPKYEERLFEMIDSTTSRLTQLLIIRFDSDMDEKGYRIEKKEIHDQLSKMEEIYLLFREERTYFLRYKHEKAIKLVVFRHMISACRKAFDTMITIEHHLKEPENVSGFDKEILTMIRSQLEFLTHHHRKLLLKFRGKIKTGPISNRKEEMEKKNRLLLTQLMEAYEEKAQEKREHEWQSFFHVTAMAIEYSTELGRLDKRIDYLQKPTKRT